MTTYLEWARIGRSVGLTEGAALDEFIRERQDLERATKAEEIQHIKEMRKQHRDIRKLKKNAKLETVKQQALEVNDKQFSHMVKETAPATKTTSKAKRKKELTINKDTQENGEAGQSGDPKHREKPHDAELQSILQNEKFAAETELRRLLGLNETDAINEDFMTKLSYETDLFLTEGRTSDNFLWESFIRLNLEGCQNNNDGVPGDDTNDRVMPLVQSQLPNQKEVDSEIQITNQKEVTQRAEHYLDTSLNNFPGLRGDTSQLEGRSDVRYVNDREHSQVTTGINLHCPEENGTNDVKGHKTSDYEEEVTEFTLGACADVDYIQWVSPELEQGCENDNIKEEVGTMLTDTRTSFCETQFVAADSKDHTVCKTEAKSIGITGHTQGCSVSSRRGTFIPSMVPNGKKRSWGYMGSRGYIHHTRHGFGYGDRTLGCSICGNWRHDFWCCTNALNDRYGTESINNGMNAFERPSPRCYRCGGSHIRKFCPQSMWDYRPYSRTNTNQLRCYRCNGPHKIAQCCDRTKYGNGYGESGIHCDYKDQLFGFPRRTQSRSVSTMYGDYTRNIRANRRWDSSYTKTHMNVRQCDKYHNIMPLRHQTCCGSQGMTDNIAKTRHVIRNKIPVREFTVATNKQENSGSIVKGGGMTMRLVATASRQTDNATQTDITMITRSTQTIDQQMEIMTQTDQCTAHMASDVDLSLKTRRAVKLSSQLLGDTERQTRYVPPGLLVKARHTSKGKKTKHGGNYRTVLENTAVHTGSRTTYVTKLIRPNHALTLSTLLHLITIYIMSFLISWTGAKPRDACNISHYHERSSRIHQTLSRSDLALSNLLNSLLPSYSSNKHRLRKYHTHKQNFRYKHS